MASGAFYSRVEQHDRIFALGHGGVPLMPGDHVVTFCGDGSQEGVIVRIEEFENYTAGSCVVDTQGIAYVRDLKSGELKEAVPHLLKHAPDFQFPEPDFDADYLAGVINYIRARHQPILDAGWEAFHWPYNELVADYFNPTSAWGALMGYRKWDPSVPKEDRYKRHRETNQYPTFEDRYAVYVYRSARGQGRLKNYIERMDTFKFITLDDCNVAGFYEKHGRDCLVIPTGAKT